MSYKIVTLTSETLAAKCGELQCIVEASGFSPELVIAIARGGVWIAQNMFADVCHMSVRVQRRNTRLKKSFLSKIVKRLPRRIQDWLRIQEARFVSGSGNSGNSELVFTIPEHLKPTRILIVDDAVDSGRTLQIVAKACELNFPQAEIRSAAITVTRSKPYATPDYSLYQDHTLIRFPWSLDA